MRYVCPRNGEPTACLVCDPRRFHAHRVEEWVTKGEPPKCPTHNLRLVPA
jgi:hypothetical protein